MKKSVLYVAGAVLVGVVFLSGVFGSVHNTSVSKEELLLEAKSSIDVAQKERLDAVTNLVDIVKSYATYESDTLTKVIEMRTTAEKGGEIENVGTLLSAVAEAYPELKASQQYLELSVAVQKYEATVKASRENFNIQLRGYKKFTRSFPNNIFLGIMGYEKLDVDYLEFGTSPDAPKLGL